MVSNDATEPSRPPPTPPHDPDPNSTPEHLFPVVGIGASAGGLEAISELLENLSPTPGMAFVLAVHLDPHHKSHLPEILGRTTQMIVREVSEGMVIERDHVYLIPPNTNMALTDGKLTLTQRSPLPGNHMPIDHLFRSMALVQGGRAIGIVLSGGGTDGSLGLQAIKEEGGIAFAQDEKSARQISMPRAAMLDGYVDYVLRPRDIARELERIARHPYAQQETPSGESLPTETAVFNDILALLRSRLSVDFAHYKQTTIKRRILRRMALRGIEDAGHYQRLLRDDLVELQSLYQDFLIRVTQFFRDPESFEALKNKVFPALVQGRPPGAPIRMWVAGCSTGEEVYSLAITLLEFLGNETSVPPIKLLATDLNDFALEKARAGVYLDNIEIDVSPERIRRFFIRQDGHYQISKAIRELCVFSRHNMAVDPPFSRLNLVSCRNVLIYMDGILQKRVLPILHYSLNPDGFLFLGSSESIGGFGDLFDAADARHRIFLKKPVASALPLDLNAYISGEGHGHRREDAPPLWTALDVQKEADRVLLNRYAPVGVVIDEAMTVLQFRGRTSAYLEPAPGMATLDLFRMLREGLLAEVRSAVNQARSENGVVIRPNVRLLDGKQTRSVQVEVIPFKVSTNGVRFFLVVFQDVEPSSPTTAARPAEGQAGNAEQQTAQMQQEIAALREYLQSVIEEQESTNEELKSANEEILSANEELQSTNEELQTAKEEAQSANEELATVNEELRHRNAELGRVNNDLVNLLSGVSIPIVMVGRDLRIRRLTPLAEKAFNLIPTDVGRPISDIKPNLNVENFGQLIEEVIDSLTPHESEVQDQHQRWYLLRIRPYVTLDSKIDGASIVLLDIDSIKRGEEQR